MQVRSLSPQIQATHVQQVSLFARHFNKSPELLGYLCSILPCLGDFPVSRIAEPTPAAWATQMKTAVR
jgi:hypothetical protein